MRLQEFFQEFVQSTKQTSTVNQDGVTNSQLMDKLIRSLIPGQTLLGEILSNKDGQVELRLDNQLLLHATLEQDMNLEVGSKMTFQVKNNGKTLTLNPLFTNTATDSTTLKAIEMAGLPLNKQSVELTREFIGRGLPIHRQSLTQAYHELTQSENTQPKDIAILHKLGIEVSEQSIKQLSNYRETAYQFETASKALIDGFVEMTEQLKVLGKTEQAQGFLKDIWNMLEQAMSAKTIDSFENENTLITAVLQENVVETADFAKGTDISVSINQFEVQDEVMASKSDITEEISTQTVDNQDRNILENKQNAENMGDVKDRIDVSENRAENERALPKDIFTLFLDNLVSERNHPQKQEIISTIKDLLLDKWLQASGLSLKDVETKEKVTELYHRLGKLLLETEQLAEQAGGKELPGFQMIKEFQQNLNFLNQVNQFSQFIQLPLYQDGKSAHGDLYVYSSKENLTIKDGKISAYLHLDMANLGSVGVYVAMENQKVNTQFTLENDESLRLIEENIEALTKRLQKRGYQLSYTTQIGSSKDKKGIAPIVNEQDEMKKIQEFSFDVRA